MDSFIEGIRSGLAQSTGRAVSVGAARAIAAGALAVFVGWIWWLTQPGTPVRYQKVTAAEWGLRWPYAGFSEGLLWCKVSRGAPATFIRLGGQDFGTNGIAYDLPGVTPDRLLLRRAAAPSQGIDSDASIGAQEQLALAQKLCS